MCKAFEDRATDNKAQRMQIDWGRRKMNTIRSVEKIIRKRRVTKYGFTRQEKNIVHDDLLKKI